jgi:hypothetical protein
LNSVGNPFQSLAFIALSLILPLLIFIGSFGIRMRWLRSLEETGSRIAARPAVACAICALAGLSVSIFFAAYVRIPQPSVHDEFAYLLAADTFAHGRLTNPTHPLWPYFETLHVLSLPTYSSKYPPAQGMALALGMLLGDPAMGLWIEAALVCAAVCWMLQAWLPGRWALLGGLLTAFHPLIIKWTQMFWGGSVQLTGAVLVCGAARRLADPRRRPIDAVWLAVGLAILANSRPFEGAVFGLVAGIGLWWALRGTPLTAPSASGRLAAARAASEARSGRSAALLRFAGPFAAVMVAVGAWMAYFNWRVTGSPLRMPYALHEAQYWTAPVLLFAPIRHVFLNGRFTIAVPPMMRYDSMRTVAVDWAIQNYLVPRSSLANFLWAAATQNSVWAKGGVAFWSFLQIWELSAYGYEPPPFWRDAPALFVLRYALLPVVVAAVFAIRRERALRLAALGLAIFLALVVTCDTNLHPHYTAPGGALAIVLAVAGLRYLQLWRPGATFRRYAGRRAGRTLVRLLVIVYILAVGRYAWEYKQPRWNHQAPDRTAIAAYVHQTPGKHIIFVYYGVPYTPGMEWVYNGADIDSQDIIWARYLGPERTQIAIDHYPDRTAWLLDCSDANLVHIRRYNTVPHPPVPDVMANPVPLPRDLVGPDARWPEGWEQPVHSGVREQ